MVRNVRIEGDEAPRDGRGELRSDAYVRGTRLPRAGEAVGEVTIAGEAEETATSVRLPAFDETGAVWIVEMLAPRLATTADVTVRFAARARALAGSGHPGLPRASAAGTWNGIPYVVLAPVDGPTLESVLAEHEGKAMPPALAARIGVAVAEAIEALHELRDPGGYPEPVLHGRLDPSRVRLPARGGICLEGVAALPGEGIRGVRSEASIAHAAPEQLVSGALDTRSDIYALGALLYELFVGRRAFPGGAAQVWKARLGKGRPRRVGADAPGVPPFVEALIDACLDPDPARRPADVAQVVASLRAAFRAAPATKMLPAPSIEIPIEVEVEPPEVEAPEPELDWGGPTDVLRGVPFTLAQASDDASDEASDDASARTSERGSEQGSDAITPEPVELEPEPLHAGRTIRMDVAPVLAAASAIRVTTPPERAAPRRRLGDKLFVLGWILLAAATVATWLLVDF